MDVKMPVTHYKLRAKKQYHQFLSRVVGHECIVYSRDSIFQDYESRLITPAR